MKKIITAFFLFLVTLSNAQVLEQYPATQTLAVPSNFINFNNKMYYFAINAGVGMGLFSTDGSANGNELIKNLGFPFSTVFNDKNKFNEFKIIYNNKLYFTFSNTLYVSDGTAAGTTVFLTTIQSAKHFKIFNNRLYFIAYSSTSGVEMWSTDGTVGGTTLLKDINPGATDAFNNLTYDPHITVFNNKLFFVANDGVHGYELWSSDGTEAGTTLFKDILPAGGGAFLVGFYFNYPNFAVFGNKMYFGANPNSTDVSLGNYMVNDSPILYETDGTAANTKVVEPPLADPNTCSCGNNTYNYIHSVSGLTVHDNKLFVSGKQAFHSFPGITNGGIYLVNGTNPISRLEAFYGYAGDVGTSDETERFAMRLYNGEYYFLGKQYTNGDVVNLWKMNPNTYGFTKITQTPSNGYTEFASSGLSLRLLVAKEINSKLFFVKDQEYQGKIFSTDGTISGTQFEAREFSKNQNETLFNTEAMTVIPSALGTFNNGLYFNAQFQTGGPNGLWRLNFASLSNDNFQTNNLSFYPNPVIDNLNFKSNAELIDGSLKIISLTGQTVFQKNNLIGTDFNFDVSNLSQGIYILQLKDGNEILNSKFIKK